MFSSYRGRRFAALLIAMVVLLTGFFAGQPESFGAFAQALGAMLLAYLAGQSATDWKKYSADVTEK